MFLGGNYTGLTPEQKSAIGGYVPSAHDLFGTYGPAAVGAIFGSSAAGAAAGKALGVNDTGARPMPTFGTNMPVAPGSSSGLFDNLLGTVGNLSPALLAGYLGNSQRQDVMGQVGRLNDVAAP